MMAFLHDLHRSLSLLRVRLDRLEQAVQMTDPARETMKQIRDEIVSMDQQRLKHEKEQQAYRHNHGALGHE